MTTLEDVTAFEAASVIEVWDRLIDDERRAVVRLHEDGEVVWRDGWSAGGERLTVFDGLTRCGLVADRPRYEQEGHSGVVHNTYVLTKFGELLARYGAARSVVDALNARAVAG